MIRISSKCGERMKRIMIVDDNEEIVEMTKELLCDENYEVETASGGEECLKKMEEFKPDLVLLDIAMPGMDGWMVIEEMQKRSSAGKTKIAVFSLIPLIKEKAKGKDISVPVHYIKKPFTVIELLEGIEEIFREESDSTTS